MEHRRHPLRRVHVEKMLPHRGPMAQVLRQSRKLSHQACFSHSENRSLNGSASVSFTLTFGERTEDCVPGPFGNSLLRDESVIL